MDISLIHSSDEPNKIFESSMKESDYIRFIMYMRNISPRFSSSSVQKMIPYITDNNFSKIQRSVGLLKDFAHKDKNANNQRIDLSDEMVMTIFWALYHFTQSSSQKLELIERGLSHPAIGELLRMNFIPHVKQEIRLLSEKTSLEEVRAKIGNQVVILLGQGGVNVILVDSPKKSANDDIV